MAIYFRDLSQALSSPQQWLSNAPQCVDRATVCRGYIDVGLHLSSKFQGTMEVTIRSPKYGAPENIDLNADRDGLLAAQDLLKAPHKPSEMEVETKIIDVDLERGIVITSMGVLQVHDSSTLVKCYDYIGQWCTILVDTAASSMRLKVPELVGIKAKKLALIDRTNGQARTGCTYAPTAGALLTLPRWVPPPSSRSLWCHCRRRSGFATVGHSVQVGLDCVRALPRGSQ